MEDLIKSLQSRRGWEGFSLKVQYVNVDLGTPTVESILTRHGKDESAHKQLKQSWTEALALRAMEEFSRAKQSANIVIADLPGIITGITEVVAVLGDCGVVVTNDWAKTTEWRDFFRRLGTTQVAQAMSRKPEEGLPSVVTTYKREKFLSGRIVGLDRTVRSWDPFVECLARVLLFDLLPTFIERRKGTAC